MEVQVGELWLTVLGRTMVVVKYSISTYTNFVDLRCIYNPHCRLENVSPLSNPGVFKHRIAKAGEWNPNTLISLHFNTKGDKREKSKRSNTRRFG